MVVRSSGIRGRTENVGSSCWAAIGMRLLLGVLVTCFAGPPVLSWRSAEAADRVDSSTLTGKLIVGYQGWFACPGDAAKLGWGHWMSGAGPTVDMLPDLTEVPPALRCPTPMKTADGQPVELFSSFNPAMVEQHFAWMRQYGLDGAALQRFATALLNPPLLKARDLVLENVRRAAEEQGRVFFVMYDLSGLAPSDLPVVALDWERLQREGLTRSPAYLHHRGHPLLGIWGLGFAGRPITPRDAEAFFDALTQASMQSGGVTILGGVPSYWRTRERDASSDPGWDHLWRRLGVISPWSVGRFSDDDTADAYRRAVLEPDQKAARVLGVDYMPVIFPGFSWANLMRVRHQPDKALFNQIPRRCGRFYWRQVYNALTAGASMLYGAMFDEVDEGTAMFKVQRNAAESPVEGIPPGTAFVALDADGCQLPSDWYLRLTGAATAALHDGIRPLPDLPLRLPSNQQ
jgi:hypothetical protein